MEDVTKQYINEEVKAQDEFLDEVLLDLENDNDLNVLDENINKVSIFFKPEENKEYLIKLTETKIKAVKSVFEKEGEEPKESQKWELVINALDKDKTEFNGLWQVSNPVMKKIRQVLLDSKKSVLETPLRIKKTGKGKQTQYDVMSNEF